MDADEREALLTLALTPGWGSTLIPRCVERLGSAQAVLGASASQLARIEGVGAGTASKLRRGIDQTLADDAPAREHELIDHHGAALIALGDADYPKLLKHIPDPPVLLWVRGQLREDDALAVGIVGARRCTHYGREQAQRFAVQCAQAGLCIVSGGAYGIDAAAHRGALQAADSGGGGGGRTIAVLGSGLARPYPEANVELFERIADPLADRGAVISELPMTSPPMAKQFPRRNRIISGLSLGVLVIEAARRSGALITARLCVEEHGREAMAVPGRVDSAASQGCHKILQDGWARLVTNAADVLDSLGEAGQLLKAGIGEPASAGGRAAREGSPAKAGSPGLFENKLSDEQRRVVEVLGDPRSLDEIAAWTKLPVGRVRAELTMLEIRGTVRRRDGLFVRR